MLDNGQQSMGRVSGVLLLVSKPDNMLQPCIYNRRVNHVFKAAMFLHLVRRMHYCASFHTIINELSICIHTLMMLFCTIAHGQSTLYMCGNFSTHYYRLVLWTYLSVSLEKDSLPNWFELKDKLVFQCNLVNKVMPAHINCLVCMSLGRIEQCS